MKGINSKEAGSAINLIMSRSKPDNPKIGMGVTILHWTDRSAGTITRIGKHAKSKQITRFWYKPDKATRTDKNGMSESQTYTYAPNPGAAEVEVRRTRRGWKVVGQRTYVLVGQRQAYHDYSF